MLRKYTVYAFFARANVLVTRNGALPAVVAEPHFVIMRDATSWRESIVNRSFPMTKLCGRSDTLCKGVRIANNKFNTPDVARG